MPYPRQTLTQIRQSVLSGIATRMPGSAPFQRRTVENTLGTILADFVDSQYGMLDWISREAVPFTSDGEFQAGWGALRGVKPQPPIAANGTVSITGAVPNTPILTSGPQLQRSDGALYTLTAGATVASDGTATVSVVAAAAGSAGDCGAGTPLTWTFPIAGVPATATVLLISGGADLETTGHFQTRILEKWASPPQGGDLTDYVQWTYDNVPSVTRCWSGGPSIYGPGSVTVFFCIDDASHTNGIPNGTNGVSQYEQRILTVATGDQLTVANALYQLRSATALVFAAAPTPVPLNIQLEEVPADTTIRANIAAAIQGCLLLYAAPTGVQVIRTLSNGLPTILQGGVLPLAYLQDAIAGIPGLDHFLIQSPTSDIVLSTTGQLSVPGSITYSNPS
jgi:uncharacterized phage protein gp47/JayE